MAAVTGVTVDPVTVAGTPDTVDPYAIVNPYWKVTVVEVPFAFTVPFKVAVVSPIPEAAVVTTVGGRELVVKVISLPFVVPFEFTPLTLQ
jgi:hypothetical protein